MTIYTEYPDFRDCPNNTSSQIKWLVYAFLDLKQKVDGLAARDPGFSPKGEVPRVSAPRAAVGEKHLDLNQYPVMSKYGKLSKLQQHFSVLGGEPSEPDCRAKLEFFKSGPKTNAGFAKHFKIMKEEAVAWTYILKKRGWIVWSDQQRGLILTQNIPLPG